MRTFLRTAGITALFAVLLFLCGIRNVSADEAETAVMYRLYNPNSGEHFYTEAAGEKNFLVRVGWNYEGVGWIAPAESEIPVYRLYNPNAGDHHYTMSAGERNYLVAAGWQDEGIGWYSDAQRRVPLFRQSNPNAEAGAHNYTVNKGENDFLVSIGWAEEGIGWYAVAKSIGELRAENEGEITIPSTFEGYAVGGFYACTHEYGLRNWHFRQLDVYNMWVAAGSVYAENVAMMDDRYLIACTTKFGEVGDLVTFYFEDGTPIPCIIADIKSPYDDNYTIWGHIAGNTISVVECETDLLINPGNPGCVAWWGGHSVVSAQNEGSIFD